MTKMIRPKIAISNDSYESLKNQAKQRNIPICQYLAELIIKGTLTHTTQT